ncbi:MAG: flagellar hook-length control protein FliK, partial [Nitrospira sp.]|nr:flagellar hook-length control protein FliK [Nitrospira sp.]
TGKHDGSAVDHSALLPTEQHVPALGDHDALGAGTEQSFSHGQQPGRDGSEPFGELWSDYNERQADNRETKIPQTFVVTHPVANGSVGESVPGGVVPSQSISASVNPPQASLSTHVQPGLHAEEMAQSAGSPAMRSVVVNVHQPDLGHVNIRVAMTNDLVHTHFSSDRLEVGQFFINGQDRLQAALQASGLDMGQFRVDIDRHSGGRSFQQSSSQEHGQPWNQGSHGMGRESNSDQQDQTRGALHGLLNVMA